ncbi:MAG: Cysteine desulfurase [Parcubacteria group bacterium]|nr:Cysteine desulfurase [Parcubacteria group bacterium]
MSFFNRKRINLDTAGGENNPSAIYREGVKAKKELENARTTIARILEVQARDVVFTSGGTEADNLAILGVFEAAKEHVLKPHIIVSSLEHPAILESAKEAQRRGAEVTIIEAEDGLVSAETVLEAIKENTVLVSVMYVNNETGVIQPVPKISRGLAEFKKKNDTKYPYMHTDASQAAGLLSLHVSSIGVDLMTLDAGKVRGSKGAGLLVVRPGVPIMPIIFGGGQERGLRSGTENVSAVVSFAEALESATKMRTEESVRLQALKDFFINEIKGRFPNVVINGASAPSAPHIVSLTFPGKLHEFLAIKLDKEGVLVSTGSSCSSGKNEEDKEALRFSFGRKTTKNDIEKTTRILESILL